MDDFLRKMGFNGQPKAPIVWPKVEFLYLDENHPETPSHLWLNARAYRIDPSIWNRPPELDLAQDDYPRYLMGGLTLIDDPLENFDNLPVLQVQSATVRLRASWADAKAKLKGLNDDL
ncbi:hypothetical protein SEA_OUTIS_68 [Gordonia phage Outis]|nr:hypothetical protein SEA_STARSTRUCK_68 [Gordonia phage StarStruck]WKW85041.1 hypothetical protein SEA_OUTIS_68 [Gordonia phage Outis]